LKTLQGFLPPDLGASSRPPSVYSQKTLPVNH